MMLVNKGLRVVHVTTHVGLKQAIEMATAKRSLKKGVSLWAGKILTAVIIGVLIKFLAPNQNHLFLGLSALAVVVVYAGYKGVAAQATVQVAAAVIVTAILVPVITAWMANRANRNTTRTASKTAV